MDDTEIEVSSNHNLKKLFYSSTLIEQAQLIYIIAILLWILIIVLLQLYQTDLVGWVFILIPIAVFAINYINIKHCSPEHEDEIFAGNFVLFFIVIVSLLNVPFKKKKKQPMYKYIFLAVSLLAISLVDICASKENFLIIKTIRTILVTISLSLSLYALYMYYKDNIGI